MINEDAAEILSIEGTWPPFLALKMEEGNHKLRHVSGL